MFFKKRKTHDPNIGINISNFGSSTPHSLPAQAELIFMRIARRTEHPFFIAVIAESAISRGAHYLYPSGQCDMKLSNRSEENSARDNDKTIEVRFSADNQSAEIYFNNTRYNTVAFAEVGAEADRINKKNGPISSANEIEAAEEMQKRTDEVLARLYKRMFADIPI